MDKFPFLGSSHTSLIEKMYEDYLKDSSSVHKEWRDFFQGYNFAKEVYNEDDIPSALRKEFKVIDLIEAYRKRGHLFTKTNPVRERRKYSPNLDFRNFQLIDADLEITFQAGNEIGIGAAKLKQIIQHLEKVYCQSIGVEFTYIRNPIEVNWFKKRLHVNDNNPSFSSSKKIHILNKLNQAVSFEAFLHKKFVGQKRFSLEGAESLIPALDSLIEHGSSIGVKEFIMGMAHRGRLNVLANIFNKTYKEIFSEFEGNKYEDDTIAGDVKYHLGFTSVQKCDNGKKVKLSLCPNPSHLEAVDPVVEGITRAKIDNVYSGNESSTVPILIHGDAALAGQGVVYEVIQMANLKGFKTGGTVHIVINNQVGFTTNYIDARSSTYCTDVGKVTLSPVFHVNGDDVEAVVHTLEIAIEYRQKFHKDVFIDLLCYRKYGHNEGDEPRFTQPLLYKIISKHPNAKEIYVKKLLNENLMDSNLPIEIKEEFKSMLESRFDESKKVSRAVITPFMEEEWKGFQQLKDCFGKVKTSLSETKLKSLAKFLYELKEKDKLFKKTIKLLNDRKKMLENDSLDWSMGELLAYAGILSDGYNIRISGQDVERGTFSHRHAILTYEDSTETISPLNNISKESNFEIYNSHLSEYGVLGFEYGYSISMPKTLVIWEAQFGDFSNGAQIIFDQFISSAEDKWRLNSGLVVLLPHGYEGQGAEHSSARIERYLQLCGQYNMEVVNCTTPANFFHLLRRQMIRSYRKPLIVFTPKSLLRHPSCKSNIKDFTSGSFQTIIDDNISASNVDNLVLCSGKIFYDLKKKREDIQSNNYAIIRLEQLYPLDFSKINKVISKYNPKKIIWVQEEPENMGPWTYILSNLVNYNIHLISRPVSAATASGSSQDFLQRQENLLNKVFENE